MFKGTTWKEGKDWLIEVGELDLTTFGKTKHEAYEMIVDAVEGQVNQKDFKASVTPLNMSEFILTGNSYKLLIALMLKRQRGKYGLTLAEMAKRLKCSINAYAQYEQGQSMPSIQKIEEFLNAMEDGVVMTFEIIKEKTIHAA